jgi:hypothetical protein
VNEVERSRLDTLAREINDEVRLCEKHMSYALKHAVAAGHKLIEAQGLMKHGEWLPWLKANFEFTPRTAANYRRLARNEKSISHLLTVTEALEHLARPQREAEEQKVKEAADEQKKEAREKHEAARERVRAATPPEKRREQEAQAETERIFKWADSASRARTKARPKTTGFEWLHDFSRIVIDSYLAQFKRAGEHVLNAAIEAGKTPDWEFELGRGIADLRDECNRALEAIRKNRRRRLLSEQTVERGQTEAVEAQAKRRLKEMED